MFRHGVKSGLQIQMWLALQSIVAFRLLRRLVRLPDDCSWTVPASQQSANRHSGQDYRWDLQLVQMENHNTDVDSVTVVHDCMLQKSRVLAWPSVHPSIQIPKD